MDGATYQPAITKAAEAADMVTQAMAAPFRAVDYETTGLHPVLGGARARVLSVAWGDMQGGEPVIAGTACVDLWRTGTAPLRPLFGGVLIAHSATFESLWSQALGLETPATRWRCTRIAYGLAYPSKANMKASLAHVAGDLCGVILDKSLQAAKNWGPGVALTPAHVRYAVADAVAAFEVYAKLKDDMPPAYAVACDAIPAAAELELIGLPYDGDAHGAVITDWQRTHDDAVYAVARLPGYPHKRMTGKEREAAGLQRVVNPVTGKLVNPSRPVMQGKGLADWLGKVLPPDLREDWPRTDTGQLQSGAAQLRAASDFRELGPVITAAETGKLLGTYGDKLRTIRGQSGRLHFAVDLAGARTGRATSSPNQQNMPQRGLKHIFAPRPGRVLVKLDYGTIELRVLACLSGDVDMLQAFSDPATDLHRETAATALGKLPADVTKAERDNVGKRSGFLSLYGGTGFGLRQGWVDHALKHPGDAASVADLLAHIPDAREAQGYVDAFWRRWSGANDWRYGIWRDLRRRKRQRWPLVVFTQLGRAVPVPPKSRNDRAGFDKRLAINAPVQGTAAEIAMVALHLVKLRLAAVPEAFVVAFVHDEIVVECEAADAETVLDVMAEAMTDGALRVLPTMPTAKLIDRADAIRTAWQPFTPGDRSLLAGTRTLFPHATEGVDP